MKAGDSNVGSGMAQKVGEDGTTGAREGARRQHDASPTRYAQSADKVNPEALAGLRGKKQNLVVSFVCFPWIMYEFSHELCIFLLKWEKYSL